MAGGSLEADGTLVQGAINMDVSEFPTLEAGFMISGVIMGEESIMVTAGPPDFGAFESGFFFLGQGR